MLTRKAAKPAAALLIAAMMFLGGSGSALAHQPFFEDDDWTSTAPYVIKDPTVSTALYATLEKQDDVDYVTFTGQRGQRVLIGLTIPQIEGQDDFAPTLALLGPGLPAAQLPAGVAATADGAVILAPVAGPARPFFEPFSRTSYWERQEQVFTLPADGTYTVTVWHPDGEVGRYTLVIGNREIPGGDVAFPFKLRAFWTPAPQPPAQVDEDTGAPADHVPPPRCGQRNNL